MATPRNELPITPAEQEADFLFKAQMAAYHWVLGYWKQGLGVIGIVLLLALVGGQTATWYRDRQRASSAALAEIVAEMPEPPELAQYGLVPRDDLNDPSHVQTLRDAAAAFEKLAADSSGLVCAEAWFRAGDTWDRLQDDDHAIAAFQASFEADEGGIYTYAAGNRLAAALRRKGETAKADAAVRELATSLDGFLAENALLDLMKAQAAAGDREALERSAAEFRARFANSARMERVDKLAPSAAAPAGS